MEAKTSQVKAQYRSETKDMKNLRLCFPPLTQKFGSMHAKLMLLSHPTHLRVVIPTANLVPYDWGESGMMENMVFLIDLPRLPPQSERHAEVEPTNFQRELGHFLTAMGLEVSIVDSLADFDWAATKNIAFVHSMGGASDGFQDSTGYRGLAKAVKALNLDTDAPLKIDYVTSSLGNLNLDFLAMLYLAAKGDDGLTVHERSHPRSRKATGMPATVYEAGTIRYEVGRGFRICYPTEDTVKASTARSAGTICLQSTYFNADSFPRSLLRDCISTRTGLLMHNKVSRCGHSKGLNHR